MACTDGHAAAWEVGSAVAWHVVLVHAQMACHYMGGEQHALLHLSAWRGIVWMFSHSAIAIALAMWGASHPKTDNAASSYAVRKTYMDAWMSG